MLLLDPGNFPFVFYPSKHNKWITKEIKLPEKSKMQVDPRRWLLSGQHQCNSGPEVVELQQVKNWPTCWSYTWNGGREQQRHQAKCEQNVFNKERILYVKGSMIFDNQQCWLWDAMPSSPLDRILLSLTWSNVHYLIHFTSSQPQIILFAERHWH